MNAVKYPHRFTDAAGQLKPACLEPSTHLSLIIQLRYQHGNSFTWRNRFRMDVYLLIYLFITEGLCRRYFLVVGRMGLPKKKNKAPPEK